MGTIFSQVLDPELDTLPAGNQRLVLLVSLPLSSGVFTMSGDVKNRAENVSAGGGL